MTLTLGGTAKEVKGEEKEEEKEGTETVEGGEEGGGEGEKEGKEEGEVAEDGKTNPAGYVIIILHLYLECRLCHRKGYF